MITYTDTEYIQTKLVLKGEKSFEGPLLDLSEWITKKYQLSVLNIIYDKVEFLKFQPRLQVILKRDHEISLFRENGSGNFINSIQLDIINEFRLILLNYSASNFNTEKLFVVFSCFENVAIQEANSKITEAEISNLLIRLK